MQYKGRLKVAGDRGEGIPIEVGLEDIFLRLESEGESLGQWRLDDVEVSRLHGNEFALSLDGERLHFVARDPLDFAYTGVTYIEEISERLGKRWSLFRRRSRSAGRVFEDGPAGEDRPAEDPVDAEEPVGLAPSPEDEAPPVAAPTPEPEDEPVTAYGEPMTGLDDELVEEFVIVPGQATIREPDAPAGGSQDPGAEEAVEEVEPFEADVEVLDDGPAADELVDEDPLDEDPLDEDPLDEDPLDEDPLEHSHADEAAVDVPEGGSDGDVQGGDGEPVTGTGSSEGDDGQPESAWVEAPEDPEDPSEGSAGEPDTEDVEGDDADDATAGDAEARVGAPEEGAVAPDPGSVETEAPASDPPLDLAAVAAEVVETPAREPVVEQGRTSSSPPGGRFGRRRRRTGGDEDHRHDYQESRTVGGITRRICSKCGHVSFLGEDVYEEWT